MIKQGNQPFAEDTGMSCIWAALTYINMSMRWQLTTKEVLRGE